MKKRILLTIMAVAAIAFGVVGMSAYEAHVINVTAKIENATDISTAALTYGTVFPQEVLHQPITLSLSTSFANSGASGVDYKIKQKPKCKMIAPTGAPVYAQVTEDAEGNFICPQGYEKMPLLCPFLSKTSPNTSDTSVSSFHGPLDLPSWTNSVSEDLKAVGHLTQGNPATTWDIDLHVPCFAGQCGQDWADYVHTANSNAIAANYLVDPALKNVEMGCDLWYELTSVNRATLTYADITSDNVVKGNLTGATITTTRQAGTSQILDVLSSSVVVANGPLADNKYAFYLQASPAQQAILVSYFAAKVWPQSYKDQINSEINGTKPFFYLNVTGGGTAFSLIDGFKDALSISPATLTIDNDYPLGIYSYTGTIGLQTITVPLTVN